MEEFGTIENRVAAKISQVGVSLFYIIGQRSLDDGSGNPQGTEDFVERTIQYNITVLDQNNEIMRELRGNLEPHLTTEEKLQLKSFIDAIFTKAKQEILP